MANNFWEWYDLAITAGFTEEEAVKFAEKKVSEELDTD